MAAAGDGLGDVAERDQADGQPPQPGNVVVVRAAFGPAALLGHLVHEQNPAVGGQEQHHGVVGHFVDEDIGHVGDHDAVIRRRTHVHGVGADAAEADDDAVVEALDDGAGDAATAGDQRVGVLGGCDELLLGRGRHPDEPRPDGIEGFPFDGESGIEAILREAGWHLHHHRVLCVCHSFCSSGCGESRPVYDGPLGVGQRSVRSGPLRSALSTKRSASSAKSMPTARQASGYRLVAVMPGRALTSSR